MSEQPVVETADPTPNPSTPPETPPPAPDGAPDVSAVLSELGIELKDGMVDPSDHVAMYAALKTLREQVKGHEAATRKAEQKARLEAMSEQERAVEEARQAGYEEALLAQREVVTRTLVTAAATAANFADPADALRYLDPKELEDEAAVAKAVTKLAADKAYLLKPSPQGPMLEQGPRGSGKPDAESGDWLGAAIRRKRA